MQIFRYLLDFRSYAQFHRLRLTFVYAIVAEKLCSCENNGFCVTQGDQSKCICKAGYAGDKCESMLLLMRLFLVAHHREAPKFFTILAVSFLIIVLNGVSSSFNIHWQFLRYLHFLPFSCMKWPCLYRMHRSMHNFASCLILLQSILNATTIHVCMVASVMKILDHSNANARMDIRDNVVNVRASNLPLLHKQKHSS